MARLLKSAYLKTSFHQKFCSYVTKPNPYEEVLKTLRLWERELKNRSRRPLRNNKEHSSEHSMSQTERTFNVHKNLPLNEDHNSNFAERTIKKENDRYYELNIREQELQNESKNFFPKDEELLIFTTGHSVIRMNANEVKLLRELACPSYQQESTESVTHSNGRTANEVIRDYESTKTKRKKSKKSKTKSSLPVKETLNPSDEYLMNNSVPVNESKTLHDDLSVHKIFPYPSSEKVTSDKSDNKGLQKSAKKSKKSSVKSKKSPVISEKSPVKSETESYHEERWKQYKLNHDIQSLISKIEAYVNANKVEQAHRSVEYLHKNKKDNLNVEVYNSVISGWAHVGRLDRVKHLFSLMLSDNIVPNLATYAGYLEAISRSKCIDVAEILDVVNKMKAQGYTPKEFLQKYVFVGDQREKVIQALGFVEQDLKLPVYDPEDAYSFKLLEKLNDKMYEREDAHFNYCFEAEDIPKISSKQMEMENHLTIKIKSVNIIPEISEKTKRAREYLKTCEKHWREVLTEKINYLKTSKKGQKGQSIFSDRGEVNSYLSLIDTEVLVNLLLQETRMLGETAEFYSPKLKVLYTKLGLKVMKQHVLSLNVRNGVTDKVHFIYKKYLSYLLDPDLYAKYSPREYWEFLKSKYCDGPTIDISNVCWPYSLIAYIGYNMYNIMRKTICFNPNWVTRKSDDRYLIPAFHIIYENEGVKLHKQVRAKDLFTKLYRDAKLEYLEFDVEKVPMLSPPHPWVKYDSGGLLITKVPFIRFPEHSQSIPSSYYSKVEPKQLNAYFDALNCLSLCPWMINKPILDIVIKIFQDGGSEELDIPLNPANFKRPHKISSDESDEGKLVKTSHQAAVEYNKKKKEIASLWFDCLYKLSIANHFREEIFWLPHNLDFRGRAYTVPPHFNHLGSDLSRSILLFADGKPLGKKGLDWLKIHLINLTGFKKRASTAERLAYANEILPEILESADNPFGKSRWWMTSDKPLQTLACCKELASAVRHPNPEEYVSHYPIHQDGSCNGLQHYAALGRDELGAIEVNLQPSSSPQDVYSGVAALVEKERDKDSKDGLEIAKVLDGFITRKVVKQPVMTFVYGVTPYGVREQVLKQLKDMPEFPEKYQHEAAAYLMKKIFLSIQEMFTASKTIQDWFTQCAEVITRVTEDAVEWVTPVGLPVIQPYYKKTVVRSSKFCTSKSSDGMNYISTTEPYALPNVRKQKNAFAPNFIHSLDSSHMMLTSLFCHRKRITFVSVHDCYWTHCVTVAAMNRICREQFVALHSEPILENLSAFFLDRYASVPEVNCGSNKTDTKVKTKMRAILSKIPEKGTFDLKKVLDSEYFFS